MSASATTTESASAIDLAMGVLGFQAGPPPWNPDGYAVDVKIAVRARCPECHKRGMHLLPFYRLPSRRYKAFHVCPECGYHQEV